jgi:hypothetical protein
MLDKMLITSVHYIMFRAYDYCISYALLKINSGYA